MHKAADSGSGKLTHADQFKALREELLENLKQTHKLETFALVGMAAVYSWQLVHRVEIPHRLLWYIVPAFVVGCALRAFELTVSRIRICKYLQRVEEREFGDDKVAGGWHRHFDTSIWASIVLGAVVWVGVVGVSVWGAWILANR